MAASHTALYVVSLGAIMIGPFLLARYFGYVWQEKMTPFFWGLFVFLAAKVPNIALLAWLSAIVMGHKGWTDSLDPWLLKVLNAGSVGLLSAVFEEGGRWVFFRAVERGDENARKPILFGLGWGACEAFFIGLSLGVTLILLTVSGTGEPRNPGRPVDRSRATQVTRWEQAGNYLLKGPAYVPLFPLVERVATLPWHILFSVLVYLSVSRRKAVFFVIAAGAHFAMGFMAGFASPRGPPDPAFALAFEAGLLVLSFVAWVGVVRIFRSIHRVQGAGRTSLKSFPAGPEGTEFE